jgi:AI-2 transport protein TqsA
MFGRKQHWLWISFVFLAGWRVRKDGPVEHGLGSLRSGFQIFFAAFVVSAALYLARVVLEPIAFALFGMALVWPFQKALEARLSRIVALALTILLVLFTIFVFAAAIVWSIWDVVHWVISNIGRFQSQYTQWTGWLEKHGIFITEGAGAYDARTFVSVLQAIASGANYFLGFSILVFLLMTFGLTEIHRFQARLDELGPKIEFDAGQIASSIAAKIRKYMLIRTLASALTGIAVFGFTLTMGIDLAIAWGVISFVVNYIPYIGSFIAVALPVIFASVQFESWEMLPIIFGGLYLIQFLIGNYVEPVIAGRALAVSPFVMLVAFFFWAFLWGIPGAFIGLPVTLALLTICEESKSFRWVAKLLSD